jgi:adenine-specific DNA-methyltransferase
LIKYLGSKRLLLPTILDTVGQCAGTQSVLDLFSGTARVGHALKKADYQVISNDHNAYAHTLATCYVQADDTLLPHVEKLCAEFNGMPGSPGYFTATFCEEARFFHPKNGARVDAIRQRMESMDLPPDLKAVMLVSLMEAADRVDSTCGVQMAYLKKWAARAKGDLALRPPALLPQAKSGKAQAHRLDAVQAASTLKADVVYLDPPYNQHSYLSNYHIWESLVLWDKPEVYGLARKRVDCRTRKSDFNSKRKFGDTFAELIASLQGRFFIVSFNNEGFITRQDMETLLSTRGEVITLTRDYKRYVGAQIGIYNPDGDKVGNVSHLRNKEHLYLVLTPGAEVAAEEVAGALDLGAH